jgi:hypothetical protein
MDVSLFWGLCVWLIIRPEESYPLWCVWVWSWSLDNEEALAHQRVSRHRKKKKMFRIQVHMFERLGDCE